MFDLLKKFYLKEHSYCQITGLFDFFNYQNLSKRNLNFLKETKDLKVFLSDIFFLKKILQDTEEIEIINAVKNKTEELNVLFLFLEDLKTLLLNETEEVFKNIRFPDEFLSYCLKYETNLKKQEKTPEFLFDTTLKRVLGKEGQEHLFITIFKLDKIFETERVLKSDELYYFVTQKHRMVFFPFKSETTQRYKRIKSIFKEPLTKDQFSLYSFLYNKERLKLKGFVTNMPEDLIKDSKYNIGYSKFDYREDLEKLEIIKSEKNKLENKEQKTIKIRANTKLNNFEYKLLQTKSLIPDFFKEKISVEEGVLSGTLDDFRFLLNISKMKGYGEVSRKLKTCGLDVTINSINDVIKVKLGENILYNIMY